MTASHKTKRPSKYILIPYKYFLKEVGTFFMFENYAEIIFLEIPIRKTLKADLKPNAYHVLKCVNNHDKLIEALALSLVYIQSAREKSQRIKANKGLFKAESLIIRTLEEVNQ